MVVYCISILLLMKWVSCRKECFRSEKKLSYFSLITVEFLCHGLLMGNMALFM